MRPQHVLLSNKLPSVTRPLRTAGSAHVTYVAEVRGSPQSKKILFRMRRLLPLEKLVWRNDADNKLCKMLEDGTTADLTRHRLSMLPQFTSFSSDMNFVCLTCTMGRFN